MALPIVKEYIKNLAKSVGYAAVDTTKMQAPAFKDFLETNEELFSDVYHGIRDITGTIEKAQKIVMDSQIYKTGDLALHNAWEDIKTGKIYNKERENAAEDAAVDNMIGSDLDFGGTEFNEETGEYEPKKSKKEDIPAGDKAVVAAVDSSMKASTIATGTAIANTGKYIATTNKAIANMQLAAQGKMLNLMSSGFGSITTGFQSLHSTMSEGLKVQTDNQKTYFETTTKLLQEQNAMMKEMLEMQRGIYKKEAQKEKEGKGNTYEDVVTASGIPNLKAYGKAIWTNFKDIIDEQTGGMGSMLNEDMLKALASNPLGGIAEFVVAGLMGNALKTNLKNFDKTLSSAFGNLISRFNYEGARDDNGFTGFISKVFGLKSSIKSSIRTDQYEKGSVPWSGKDSMSLQVVIPSYLSRIEAALTGKKARLFDYEKGVFTLKEDAEKNFANQRKQYARSATSDVRSDVEKQLSVFGFDYETQKRLKDYLDNAFEQIYADFGQFNVHDKTLVSRYKGNFNGNEELTKLFIKAMSNVDRDKKMQLAPEVMSQRQAQDQSMKRIEKEGVNPFINLYREFAAQNGADPELKLWGKGSYKEGKIKDKISSVAEGRIDKVTDAFKKTVFDYLRDISLTLRNIRELNAAGFAYGGGGGGGGNTFDESNVTINNMTKADIFAMPTDNKAQRMRRTRFISMYNKRVAQLRAQAAASSSEMSNVYWNAYNKDNSEVMMGDRRRKTPTQENIDYENNQRAANNRRVEEKLRSGEMKLKFNGDNLGEAQSILDTMRKIKDAKNEAELNTQYNELAKILHTRADRAKELADTLMGAGPDGEVELDENGKPVKRKKDVWGFKVDEGSIVDKLMTAGGVMEKVKVIQDELASLVTRPTDALAGVIAKADEHIYDFFFSKDANETDDQGNRITGMFGYMKNEMKKGFKEFNRWIDKEILQKLKDKFGGESAWEAAGNAIEKYTGFNPYKGVMTLKDKIIGTKGEDGQREGGFLSNFLNKINDDLQDTLLNLKDSIEEKFKPSSEEEAQTSSTPIKTGPLTLEEVQNQHWSRDEARTKKEFLEARREYNQAKKNIDSLDTDSDRRKKAKQDQIEQYLKDYKDSAVVGGLLEEVSLDERFSQTEETLNKVYAMVRNRKEKGEFSQETLIEFTRVAGEIQNILTHPGNYPIDDYKLGDEVDFAIKYLDECEENERIPKSTITALRRIVRNFAKTDKYKLSAEQETRIDDQFDSIKQQAEQELQALEARLNQAKSRADYFRREDKAKMDIREHKRSYQKAQERRTEHSKTLSRLQDQMQKGEITPEDYRRIRTDLENRLNQELGTSGSYRQELDIKDEEEALTASQKDRRRTGTREISQLRMQGKANKQEDIENLIEEHSFATGGVVPKTGLYFLSKDEQVIPTSHMEEDAARENALIAKLRKQYPDFNFEGQYAYGTGTPQPVFTDETLKEHRYKEGEDGWWVNELSRTSTKNINGRQFLREETTRNDLDPKNTERYQEVPGADGVTRLVDRETNETFINIDGKWIQEREITKASQLKKGSTGNIIGSIVRTGIGGAFNRFTDAMKYDPEKDGENKPMSRQAMDALRDGFSAVTENFLYGSDPEKTKEKLEQVKKETINAMPYAVSGGMMGLVPGLVMGAPFLGALVGAGLNVVNKSDTMSDWLFGARDENGNRKDDGFISKDTQDMLKKYMPDVKLFGSIGSIAGLLTGLGPIPGLMIGGAAAFVKNNEEASNVLFGDDGLIGKHAKEKLKKAAPNIFAGAGAGALFGLLGGSLPVFGPLGLLGGLAAGAGIGLISTTDSFKDAILGPKDREGKRHGGLVGSLRDAITDPIRGLGNKISGAFTRYIKEDLIGPVARSVAPFTKVLQLGANKMFSAIGSAFSAGINKVFTPAKDLIMSGVQALLQRTPLGRFASRIGGGLKNGIAGIISAPSKLIGMAGDWTRQKLIQSGNAGDFMSSDEQLSFMDDRGINDYKYKEMNQKLSEMNSMELERQLGNIDMMLDSNRNIEDERKKESDRFNSEIKANHHILPIERKKLIKLVKAGKIEEAHEYVMGLRLPQDEKRSILESIEGHTNRMSDIDNFGDSSAQTEDMYAKLSESFGFEVNESNIHKLRAQLKTDIKSAKIDEEEVGAESEELKAQLDSNSELKMQTDLLTEIRDRLDALRGVQSGDLSRLKPGQRMAYDMQRDSSSWYRNNYDKAVDADSNTINETVMAAFTNGRDLTEEERAKYVVSDSNRDILANNARNPNTPEKAERLRRLGEVNKLNLTPGQINLLIGTPDKEFKALIKTFELGFNLSENDIVTILKCNRQIGGDRASTNLNILLDNEVPIYRLTDNNGDTQKFLAVRKEVLDNMIRIRDDYLPGADAEALYEVYARHKNGLFSDTDTYADSLRVLDRELGEDFRKGMERRTRDASVGYGEKGDQERGRNTAGSASRLFDAVHAVDSAGRAIHGFGTGKFGIPVGVHAFGGIAKAGLNILSKGEQLVSTAKSGIDAVRESSVFKGAKSVASGIYKAGKFVKNMVTDPIGTATGAIRDGASYGYNALKKSLEDKAGENGEEGENKGEKVVNTDYGPMIYKKSMSGDYTLANTKDNVNIKNAIANRDDIQSQILAVLEQIRDNGKLSPAGAGEEKSGGGMGLLGMLGALAAGAKKLFSGLMSAGKGIYKGIRGIFKLGKAFGKTAIKFFGKLLTKIGLSSLGDRLSGGAGGGGRRSRRRRRRRGRGRRRGRFGRGAYGLGNPLIGLAGLTSTIGTGTELLEGGFSFDDDFDDVDLGDFVDESETGGLGDDSDTEDIDEDFDEEEDDFGVDDAVLTASQAADIGELKDKKKKPDPNKPNKPSTPPEPERKPGMFESAKQKIQAGIDWGMEKLRSAGQSIKDTVSSGWEAIKGSNASKAVGNYIEQVKSQVIDKMKSVANFIVDKAPKISADKMKAFFDKILARVTKPEKLAKIAEKIAIKAGFSSAEAAAGAGTFGIGTAVLATAEIAFWFSQGAMNAAESFELGDGVEPTAGMRFISGIAEAFCGCTPVGYVLEGSDIIAIGKETLGEILGASNEVSKELNDAVKTAQSEQSAMAAGVQSDYFKAENSAVAATSSDSDWFSSMKDSIANSYIGRKATGAVSWAKDKLSNVANGVKSFFGFGKYGPSDPTYGMGGFYSQKDPSIANTPFNIAGDSTRQTIGDSACGPAALMNIASALGKDKFGRGSGDLVKASMDALAYKEKDGGTKPGYFNAEANKLGFSTKQVPVSSVDRELDQGHPVIMMGQDNSMGMGKYGQGGPVYGPYPHYIAVTGKDDQGNYIVQDSEGSPNQRVSGKYLKDHSSLAMAGMGKWGRGPTATESTDKTKSAEQQQQGSKDLSIGEVLDLSERGLTKRSNTTKIIIHHTAGSGPEDDPDPDAATIDQWHTGPNNNWAAIGYHFVIRKSGSIERGRPEDTVGSHCYQNNSDSIGIHVGGNFIGTNKPTDAQVGSLIKLIVYLCQKYKIPVDRQHIKGHREYNETECPGDNLYAMLDSIVDSAKKLAETGELNVMVGGTPVPGSKTGNTTTSGSNGSGISGFFGGLQRIYDAFASIFSFGSSKSGGNTNTPGGNQQGTAAPGSSGSAPGTPGNASQLQGLKDVKGSGTDFLLQNMPGSEITSSYPYRNDGVSLHGGTDIGADEGLPIPSPVSGKIVWANDGEVEGDMSGGGGYGNAVTVEDANGNLNLMAHMTQGSVTVSEGQQVKKGDVVGKVGNTGHSFGAHLHYQVDPPSNSGHAKYGDHLDPNSYDVSGLGKYGLGGNGEIVPYNEITNGDARKNEEQYGDDSLAIRNNKGIFKQELTDLKNKPKPLTAEEAARKGFGYGGGWGRGKWGRGPQNPVEKKQIWDYLLQKGYSPKTAAAIMGNMGQESGWNPWKLEGYYDTSFPSFEEAGSPRGRGYGLFQWTITEDDEARLPNMVEYARSTGRSNGDYMSQIDFMTEELTGDPSTSKIAQDAYVAGAAEAKGYGNLVNYMDNASLDEATVAFEESFERAGTPMNENRISYANEVFNEFANGASGNQASNVSKTAGGASTPNVNGNNTSNGQPAKPKSSGFAFLDKIGAMAEKLAGQLKQQLAAAFGNIKIPESFKKAYSSIFGGDFDLLGSLFGGSSASASPGGGAAQNGSPAGGMAGGVSVGGDELRQKVVDLAKAQVGKSYVMGATGPDSFDCSGLLYWIANQIGLNINRCADDQYDDFVNAGFAHPGSDLSQARPGDFIFTSGSGDRGDNGVGHAGVYIGNGQWVEAMGSDWGVVDGDVRTGSMVGWGDLGALYQKQHPELNKEAASKTADGTDPSKASSVGDFKRMDGNAGKGKYGRGLLPTTSVYEVAKDMISSLGFEGALDAADNPELKEAIEFVANTVGIVTNPVGALYSWAIDDAQKKSGYGLDDEETFDMAYENGYGTGKWGRGIEIDSKYFNENIPEYNKIDLDNDSQNIIQAKMKAIDKWYASQGGNDSFRSEAPKVSVPDYKKIDLMNDTVDAPAKDIAQGFASTKRGLYDSYNSSGNFNYFRSDKAIDNAKRDTVVNGITQANINTFKGGEYFNDTSKVCQEVRDYLAGKATLEDVAKAIGFNGMPDKDAALSVEQQQMLGYEIYSKVCTWGHFLRDVELWKNNSGKVPVDRWMKGKESNTTKIPDYNKIDLMNDTIDAQISKAIAQGFAGAKRTYFTGTGKYGRGVQTANGIAQGFIDAKRSLYDSYNSSGNFNYFRSDKAIDNASRNTVVNGITQANISTFKGGEYFNDTSKVCQEVRDYLAGKATLEDVAKAIGFNGMPDKDAALSVEQQQMLGYEIYSKVCTWGHFLRDVELWKRNSGKVPVDRWMKGKESKIHDANKIDLLNDSIDVQIDKAIAQGLAGAKETHYKSGTGKWGKGIEIGSKYFNESIPEYNKIDMDNDSQSVIEAKMKAIDKWYASQSDNDSFRSEAPEVSVPDYKLPIKDNTNIYSSYESSGNFNYFRSSKAIDNASRDTVVNGITQANISTFKGGEYFNDPSKVCQEVRDYLAGKATLEDIAKAIGFNGMPDKDAALSVEQQQMLGYEIYSKICNWGHFLRDVELWKRNSGKVPVDRWMKGKFHGVNKIDLMNDPIDVQIDKAIAQRLAGAKRTYFTGTGKYGRGIPDYLVIDHDNDSNMVIKAKQDALNKWYLLHPEDMPNEEDTSKAAQSSINVGAEQTISEEASKPRSFKDLIRGSKTYNSIDLMNDTTDVQTSKAIAQGFAGAKRTYFKHGTGKYGRGFFDWFNNKVLGTAKDFIFGKQQKTLAEKTSSAEVAAVKTKKITDEDPRITRLKDIGRSIPKGFWDKYPYNRPNDWNNLDLDFDTLKIEKMAQLWEKEKATNPNWETDYTGVEDIPETVYKEVDENGNPLAPNGMPFEQNDIDYLVNNGYTKEDALKFLATDKKYTTKPEENKTVSAEAAAEEEAKEKARKEKEEYEAKQPGMAKLFGWDAHKQLEKYYEEKERLAAEKKKTEPVEAPKGTSNVEKLKQEQAKAAELKEQQEQAEKTAAIQTKEAEAKAEQAKAAAVTTDGENYQEKVLSLLTAAVQYLAVIAGNGGRENAATTAQQQNMVKMKSDLRDIINGTSNIGGISDLVGGSDMSSIMKTLNLVATR